MTLDQAQTLIQSGFVSRRGKWADIGAGTGIFTLAIASMLISGNIYAVDKNPHALWDLAMPDHVRFEILEGDFTQPLDLPLLDGMIMANALHMVSNPQPVLSGLLRYLKPGGAFLLVEYETTDPVFPWVPFPVPLVQFKTIAQRCKLTPPVETGRMPSRFGHDHIYAVKCLKMASDDLNSTPGAGFGS